MDYVVVQCSDGRDLKMRVKEMVYRNNSDYQEIAIYDTEEFGKCLFLDGIIQSSERDHDIYDRAMLEKLRPSDCDLLILGGGDGYIAEKAIELNPLINVTIVDLDREVVNVCREYLSQRVFDNPRVRLVIRDALEFIIDAKEESFDGIISDLTDFPVGYDNRLRELFSHIFDRARRILKEGGWISLYGGVKGLADDNGQEVVDLLKGLLQRHFPHTECMEIFIPSFGEPCYFLYGSTHS